MRAISLKWDITGKCNLRCKHCLQGDRLLEKSSESKVLAGTPVEIGYDQIICIVDKLPSSDIVHINFLGGEPTLLGNKFISIVKHCVDKGIKTTFNTNGLKLKRSFIEEVIKAGAAGIIISIDGPTADSHDAIRGKGTFEIIKKNLSSLMKYIRENNIPFETTISTVLTPYNGNIIGKMVDFCVEMDVDSLNLLPLSYTGYAIDNIRHLYLTEDDEIEIAEKFVKYLYQRPGGLEDLKIECRFILPPLANYLSEKYGYSIPIMKNCCSATTTFGYINPSGDLYPCDRVAYDFSNIDFGAKEGRRTNLLKYDFYEVWNSEFYTKMFQFITNRSIYKDYTPCNRCEYLDAGLCVPCPLFTLQKKEVSYYMCSFVEKKTGGLKLPDDYKHLRTGGSHYLNQYQPKRKEIIITDSTNRNSGKRLKKVAGIRWNMDHNREILFNPYTNKFYSVNSIGRKIWNLIDAKNKYNEIVQVLMEENINSNNHGLLSQDIDNFINSLISEGLIEAY